MTDWNPSDPEAQSVRYDLSQWSIALCAEVVQALAEAGIVHYWNGTELVVSVEDESSVDSILDGLESGASPETIRMELVAGEPITEYELDEWSERERAELTEALVEAGITHRWDATVLLVASSVESDVDDLLDDIENSSVIINGDDENTDNGGDENTASGEVLSRLFLAAQRLGRDPMDSDGLNMLVSVLEEIEGARAPYGLSDSVWRQIVDLASQVEDALAGGDRPDEATAMDLAGRLYAILRSHV